MEKLRLLSGVGFGGGATVPKNEDGERENVIIGFDLVFPLIIEVRRDLYFAEVELGYLKHILEKDLKSTPGLRLGLTIGSRLLRKRWGFPAAAFSVLYDYLPKSDLFKTAVHTIKFGGRVSFDLEL